MRFSDEQDLRLAKPARAARRDARSRRFRLLCASLLLVSASGCALLLDATTTPGDHCVFKGQDTSCGHCLVERCQPAIDLCCGDARCAPALSFVDDCAASADLDACRALRIGTPPLRADLTSCANDACGVECSLRTSTTSTGMGGGGGAGGASGTSASTSATSTGGGGDNQPPGVTWVSLAGDRAEAGSGPNDALAIRGGFHAVGDGCAELHWDPATRCATGVLCDPGFGGENWGVAILFDFHDTGPAGFPPDTKSPWNATSLGARGLAWSVTGSAPGLQVWITNMDPAFNGTCSLEDCSIQGPPDGTGDPKLGQTLLFTHLAKDNWGGTGIPYTFDATDILAVQFKLSSLATGAQSFSYCVDQIGVVMP